MLLKGEVCMVMVGVSPSSPAIGGLAAWKARHWPDAQGICNLPTLLKNFSSSHVLCSETANTNDSDAIGSVCRRNK